MSALKDYLTQRAIRTNPTFAKQYYAEQNATKMAQLADQIYGKQARYATEQMAGPVQPWNDQPTREVMTSQGTGMFDPNIDPKTKAMLMNKRMLASGNQGFQNQWSGNQGNMQNSSMSNMGTMTRQIQAQHEAQANPTATSTMKNLQAQGLVPGTPAYQQAMNKYMNKSGVTVNTGAGGLQPGWMSDEDKAAQGIPLDTPIWTNAKGDPKVVAGPDVGRKKATAAISQLEASTSTLNDVLNEYDPSSLAEITTSLLPLPTAIANKLRNETERTVASAKKGWKELVLRDATGAVINKSEYDDYDDIYMPQPGEGPAELERKAKLRHTKENMFRRMVGQPEQPYESPYDKPKDGDVRINPKTGKRQVYRGD